MNVSLTLILLLAGAGGEGKGFGLQAQLGYEPAILYKGKDYQRQPKYPAVALFMPPDILYMSNAVRGKAGVAFGNDLKICGTGSIAYSVITDPGPGLDISLDSIWEWYLPPYHNYNRLRTFEYSAGLELGYAFNSLSKYWRQKGIFYVGFEGVWGTFYGSERWTSYKFENEQEIKKTDTFHVINQVKGCQGYIGLGVPLSTFGCFGLQLHSMLKGGAVKEQSIELIDTPAGTQWEGPRTLLKWGVVLGLTLNYNGGKQ